MPVKTLQSELGGIQANSFEELAAVALGHLRDFEKSEIVCDPITSGGAGNLEDNLLFFACAIDRLRVHHKRPMFNQLPYEPRLWQLEQDWFAQNPNEEYCRPILDVFYMTLFDSGLIKGAHFLPGWRTSKGATWEHGVLSEKGVVINYLNPGFAKTAVRATHMRMGKIKEALAS